MSKVQEVLEEYLLSINPGIKEILPEQRLIEDLNLDSLDVVELSMHIEEKLNVQIEDDDLEKAKTVGDLTSMLRSKYNIE